MSTRTFAELIAGAENSPGYWKRGATLGFVYGIDRLLKKLKKSRAFLAERAGMDESTVSRALSGKQNLTIATMDKMAAALGAAVHIHVEDREILGGWVPVSEMRSPASPMRTETRLVDFTFDYEAEPTSGREPIQEYNAEASVDSSLN